MPGFGPGDGDTAMNKTDKQTDVFHTMKVTIPWEVRQKTRKQVLCRRLINRTMWLFKKGKQEGLH